MNEDAAKAGASQLIRLLEEKLEVQIGELEAPTTSTTSTNQGDSLSDEEAWKIYQQTKGQ